MNKDPLEELIKALISVGKARQAKEDAEGDSKPKVTPDTMYKYTGFDRSAFARLCDNDPANIPGLYRIAVFNDNPSKDKASVFVVTLFIDLDFRQGKYHINSSLRFINSIPAAALDESFANEMHEFAIEALSDNLEGITKLADAKDIDQMSYKNQCEILLAALPQADELFKFAATMH